MPSVLFAAGEQGAWYDPGDLPTLFQDSAGTTPGAVGQPIGLATDKSGRGNNATQVTTTSRPSLVQPVSFLAARSDGVDDSLSSATGGGGNTGFLLCAAITLNAGGAALRAIMSDISGSSGYHLRLDGTNKLQLSAGNGAAFTAIATTGAFAVGETHVVTAYDDGTSIAVQIDNGAVASVGRPAVAAGSAGFTLFKSNAAASEFFPGDCYQLVYVKNSAKTPAERAMLKTFVGARAGLSL